MQNRKNVGYDETKKMLKTLRQLTESIKNKGVLKEQEMNNDVPVEDSVDNINDVDVKLISSDKSDMNLTDEQKTSISGLIDSFREQVSQIANLEPGLTINMNQIRLDGTISDIDLSFVLISGEDSGLFINADMLKIEDDVVTTIDKLSKFQLVFEDTMTPIIRERNSNI